MDQASSSSSRSSPTNKSFNVACQRCRKRKVKCDLVAPTCGNCSAANAQCVATRLSSSRAANSLAPGFLENLEAEVARLEDELAHSEKGPTPSSRPGSGSRSRPYDSGPYTFRTPGLQNIDSGFDWSTIGEAGAGSLHPRLGYNMSRMLQSAFSVDNTRPYSSTGSNSLFPLIRPSVGTQHFSHPSMPGYLEVYFAQVHPVFPFLNEPAIRDAISGSSNSQSETPTVLMVLAIGATLSPKQGQISAYHGIELFASACGGGLVIGSKNDLSTLQFGLLATIFSLFNPAGGSSWYLLGLCVQMAVTLGLHQRRGSASRVCETTLGENAFWTCFILDRIISKSLGRPYAIDERDLTTDDIPDAGHLSMLSALAIEILSDVTSNESIETLPGKLKSAMEKFLAADFEFGSHGQFSRSLSVQLLGWVFTPKMLTESFGSNTQAFETIVSCLDLALGHFKVPFATQLSWILGYSILHISLLRLYASRLITWRDGFDVELSSPLNGVGYAIRESIGGFDGLGGLHTLFNRLVDGGPLDEMKTQDVLDAVRNPDTRETIQCVVRASLTGNSSSGSIP